jgi:hypothetical protein
MHAKSSKAGHRDNRAAASDFAHSPRKLNEASTLDYIDNQILKNGSPSGLASACNISIGSNHHLSFNFGSPVHNPITNAISAIPVRFFGTAEVAV